MKKVLLVLILLVGSSFGIQVYESLDNTFAVSGEKMVQIDLRGQDVASSGTLNITVGYGAIESMYISDISSSTGNITSSAIDWKLYPADNGPIENATIVSSSALAVETAMTSFQTSLFTLSLINPVATANTVSGSIYLILE